MKEEQKEIDCTIVGCTAKFKTYDEFSKHIHQFHGIDEM